MLKIFFTKHFSSATGNSPGKFNLNIQFQVVGGLTILFGPSGCGKSSTLRAIAGLLCPDNGLIEVEGTVFFDHSKKLNLPTHQRQIGYVFQNYALFPHLNVRDNIGFALNRWPPGQRRKRVEQLINLLEIQDLVEQPINYLSGGQAQRVAIARALAPYPKILLLDEPFSALDDQLKETLRKELKIIQRQFKLPIILVTHSRSDALELADNLIILSEGKVVRVGQASELLDSRSYSLPRNFHWG